MNDMVVTEVVKYVPSILNALIILIIGGIAAYSCKVIARRWVKGKNNKIFSAFMANLVFTLILAITVVISLTKLGVPTTTLVAIMGAASLAIGLALKNFLANIAAGFIIVFLKPFKIGDYIVANGDAGTIMDINLFMTRLKSSTNECLFIPNNKLINGSITNQSYYDTRRIDLAIGVGYATDLQLMKPTISQALEAHELVLKDPTYLIGVQDLADSSIQILVRFWVARPNFIPAKLAVLESIKIALTKEGISIPFPQMDLHVIRN